MFVGDVRSGLSDLPAAGAHEAVGGGVKKSQDAAVGALVRMLKKAPPLHNDTTCDPKLIQSSNEISQDQQYVVSPKTTSDALEELRGYTQIKDLLLNQSKIS